MSSFPCKWCGADTGTTDSRPFKGIGSIRRRRKCVKCDRRFTTIEVDAKTLVALSEVASTLADKLSVREWQK